MHHWLHISFWILHNVCLTSLFCWHQTVIFGCFFELIGSVNTYDNCPWFSLCIWPPKEQKVQTSYHSCVCLMRRGKDLMLARTCAEFWIIQFVDLLRELIVKCVLCLNIRWLLLQNLYSICCILSCRMSLWDLV